MLKKKKLHEDKELFNLWNNARANKDFESADKYRNMLMQKGLI